MDERRDFSRVDFKVNALLQVEGGVVITGEVKDLSLHGAFVETTETLPIATGVELTIYLSGAPEPVVINVSGQVVRVDGTGIGCVFDKMDVESFAHLRSVISYQGGHGSEILAEFAEYARKRTNDV